LVDAIIINILGASVLLATALGANYARGLRKALGDSVLASVWKNIELGSMLLFLGALIGGGIELFKITSMDSFAVVLFFILLAALSFNNGLKMQLSKIK